MTTAGARWRAVGARGVSGVRAGFTILEVLIVIGIIAALATVVVLNLRGQAQDAKIGIAEVKLKRIKDGLSAFNTKFSRYPTDDEGLKVLWDKSALTDDAEIAKWYPFVEGEDTEKDPWGTPWGYRSKSEHGDDTTFDLWSYGPDKADGTDDDIVSWKKEDAGGGAKPSGGR